jgi:hypothetical protein
MKHKFTNLIWLRLSSGLLQNGIAIATHLRQGCPNGRFWVKLTVRMSTRVRVYPADATLPANSFYRPRL